MIVDGWVARGARLPSTRQLAMEMGISRGVVVAALEDLQADGWLFSRSGSGTFVAETRPGAESSVAPVSMLDNPAPLQSFAVGVPGLDLFPTRVWGRLQERRWGDLPPHALQEGDSAGWSGLRAAIAGHLRLSRGIRCKPSQVIVTNSIRAAIFLCAQVLGRRSAPVWVENPGYFGITDAVSAAGLKAAPVPVDEEGLRISDGLTMAPDANLAVVTPHAQFPTGVEMSPDRRAALAAWAEANEGWIIENGYESEISLNSVRPNPVFGEATDRVIYVNSFHRVLYPGLRIGYAVLPEQLVAPIAAARAFIDGHSNVANQMVLEDFITGGHLDDHIRTCREVYRERRACLASALTGPLSEALELQPGGGGSHVVAAVRGRQDARDACRAAAAHGIDLTPMSQCMSADQIDPRVLLGFAAFKPPAIRGACRRLLSMFQQAAAPRPFVRAWAGDGLARALA